MSNSPIQPERIAEDVARQLLERATTLDSDGPTLSQLRQAAAEAGISNAAFDAAVAEWRANSLHRATPIAARPWAERALRNAAGIAIGWAALGVLGVGSRLVDAPWLVHKLTDPIGLAIGAVVAARIRARTATILLGGLAVSQGAEFLMDLFSGTPAISGFGAHAALMIAGVAGVALGRSVWGHRGGPSVGANDARANVQQSPYDGSAESRSAHPVNTDDEKRFMELLRIRHRSYSALSQLNVGVSGIKVL